MADKVRVFKLAKEFGLDNDAMVAKIQNMGFAVRNYMSGVDPEDAERVRRLMDKEREENTVEEQIRPTVVRRRVKTAAPAPQAAPRTRAPKPKAPKVTAAPGGEEDRVSDAALPSHAAVAEASAAQPEPTEREAAAPSEAPVEPAVAVRQPAAPSDEAATYKDAPLDHSLIPEEFFEHARREEERVAIKTADGPAERRPASEAPIIRRRIQTTTMPIVFTPPADPGQASDDSRKGKGPRRRQVESREISASRRFTGTAPPGFAAPPGRKRRMTPGKKGKKTEITTPKAIKRIIRIDGQVTLQELAKRMSVKATELLMKLIGLGMAGININSTLDIETAKIVAEEFGYDVEDLAVGEDDLLSQTRSEDSDEDRSHRETRAPIVTMMGHVDHGKTSLLDYIRKANVVAGEAGGITQHIGAYRAKTSAGEITFIDTPGHAAFSAMRARGADVTDLVVLVTAADDGVMPQTVEAIAHARAAGCPIIVAVNKCDLPGADPDRTRRMLMEHNLIPEELGGETIMVNVSAKTGEGVDKLMDMILIQSEVMELDANPIRPGRGVVLEAYLDKGRGPVANVLIKDGTLHTGDIVVVGSSHGKIRALTDELGRKVNEAGPSTPVELLGLSAVPGAGDTFDVVPDMKLAEKVAEQRVDRTRAQASPVSRPSLEALYQQMQGTGKAELKIIIKSDVQGTTEALRDALEKLSGEKVRVVVVHASPGGITESDVNLASTAEAIIIGFNVRPAGKARKLAEEQHVDIKLFSIIYEVVDAVKAAMLGLLSPTKQEEALGVAEVRNTFTIPKIGTVAGSYVTEGKVIRSARARLYRDSVQVWEGRLSSLRRFKDDTREVASGFECGICLEGYNDIKVGDLLEFYVEKEVEATLS